MGVFPFLNKLCKKVEKNKKLGLTRIEMGVILNFVVEENFRDNNESEKRFKKIKKVVDKASEL